MTLRRITLTLSLGIGCLCACSEPVSPSDGPSETGTMMMDASSSEPAMVDDGGDGPTPEDEIEIHTWWNEASESLALDAISRVFNNRFPEVTIRLTTIDGQSDASIADLEARVERGDYPDVFQTLPRFVGHWMESGDGESVLLPLDALLDETGATGAIPDPVMSVIRTEGQTFGAPLGLHRHNSMFLNQNLVDDLGLVAPRSLADFTRLCDDVMTYDAAVPESQQVWPAANTPQGWALELAFRSILIASAESLSPGQGGQYLADFMAGRQSIEDREFVAAAEFLNTFFRCSNQPPSISANACVGGSNAGAPCQQDSDCAGGGQCPGQTCQPLPQGAVRPTTPRGVACETHGDCPEGLSCLYNYYDTFEFGWSDAAALLRDGKAVTFVHGDWVRGEYDADLLNYDVVPAFGTDDVFLYNVDTLATFTKATHPINARNFMQMALSVEGQAAWSIEKGSTPARRDVATDAFNDVAKATYADYLGATYLQATESTVYWFINTLAFTRFWQARSRDDFASEGDAYEQDLAAFLTASADGYRQAVTH